MKTYHNDHNPMQHFQRWFYKVKSEFPEDEINAMNLCTVDAQDIPKCRVVLLKSYSWEGFVFYTNYHSEKGKALEQNNRVSIIFDWKKSGRLIEVLGEATKIPQQVSENYFQSRPRGSQLAAWASAQSSVVPNRQYLEEQLRHYEQKFEGKTVPMPPNWGGYMVSPKQFYFKKSLLGNIERITGYQLEPDDYWSLQEVLKFSENVIGTKDFDMAI